jgi:hypothetical protein
MIAIDQFEMAFIGATAVRLVNGAAAPGASAVGVHAEQNALTQQQLLPPAGVRIPGIDPARRVAADDPALEAAIGAARDLDDALTRLSEPATEDRAGRRILRPYRRRAQRAQPQSQRGCQTQGPGPGRAPQTSSGRSTAIGAS